MRRFARSALIGAALVATLASPLPGPAGAATGSGGNFALARASAGTPGPLSGAARRAAAGELLPADPAELEVAKAEAASRAGSSRTRVARGTSAPTIGRKAMGLSDVSSTPSDSTGAIGPTRYIETVNRKVGIYDRNLNLLASDTLQGWWAEPGSNSFDPQVIWDATTNRFYYAGAVVYSAVDNRLAFGFSTTASPNNATTDWCHYDLTYGSEFADFPKLGDSRYFSIIGVNVFNGQTYRGSDVLAIGKPPSGTACPAASTFPVDVGQNLEIGGIEQFTPVPANEIDKQQTGWVLTRSSSVEGSSLGRFRVTRNATTGDPIVETSGVDIDVPTYAPPANAPQKDGAYLIDTSDARLTQAVAAFDPSTGGRFVVWTQHAIAGGAGSQERWYEIDPAARSVVQSGQVSHSSLYIFNGAISPDRVVSGRAKAFGANMVLGYTTSSPTTYPAIRMVSKRGADGVSSPVLVRRSPGHDEDFGCPQVGLCRWGDYSGATPDPKAAVDRSAGVVWLTNMWTADADTTGGDAGVSWRTWNWSATP